MERHHACLVYADSIQSSVVPEFCKIQSVDVLHFVSDRFGIDDARELSRLAQQQPFESAKRLFVVCTTDIAIEAQNALLKLFEEPPQSAEFYIVLKKTSFLLPTLKSRLFVLGDDSDTMATTEAFATFVTVPYVKRLALISEKTKEKDIQWIDEILLGYEVWVKESVQNREDVLSALVTARTFIHTKGASIKMLLEDLALRLPTK
jgi:hypothetical protein